jgi:2-oxoisovalerate dehydrogenase E1 component beta subunit
MARMTMIEAVRSAMDVSMGRDEDVVVFGEDVGYFGGVFRCTQGLQAKYGKTRCFDAPISESGIVGTAIGMAAYGLKPCVEIQFADYMYPAYDQLTQEAARIRYRSNGDFTRRAHADRGRHLRRPDAQPEPGGAVHPCLRPEGHRAVEPL